MASVPPQGGLPVIVSLGQLDGARSARTLTEPRNSCSNGTRLCSRWTEWSLTENALHAIAKKEAERIRRWRGCAGLWNRSLRQLMFDLPSDEEVYKVTITGKTVTDGEPPILLRDRSKRKRILAIHGV